MEFPWLSSGRAAFIGFIAGSIAVASADPFQVISAVDPAPGAQAGGSGDSEMPIVSPDGRYVLFSSAANNLLGTASNAPLPSAFPPKLNVFLRDRTKSTTTLVSVNHLGTDGGNGDSVPIMFSTNAQYALFESCASDLVGGDTNDANDIFVRDLVNGITTLVSVSTNGAVGREASRNATMTPDGRYVAFVSAASDLVPYDTNYIPDIFVRDLVTRTTTLVSVGARSKTLFNPYVSVSLTSSESPLITPDGRYITFFSTATNLVPGVLPNGDIYLRDLLAGTTTWVSRDGRAALNVSVGTTNGICYNHKLSDDGQFIAYEVSQKPSGEVLQPAILLRYNAFTDQTQVVGTNAHATWFSGQDDIHNMSMTPDGRFIAFVGNTNGTDGSTTCIYLWDAQTETAVLVSTNLIGTVASGTTCDWVALDPEAHWVMFQSTSPNMVTNPLVGDLHLYFHNLQTGTTMLVNSDPNGIELPLRQLAPPGFSANGRLAAFECQGGTIVPGPLNRASDIFLRDLVTGVGEVVSVHAPGQAAVSANGSSSIAYCSASADGRYVAFFSDANNLSANDTNLVRDIYVRDQVTGSNVLVSVSTNGFAGDYRSMEPAISGDGRYVVFSSTADDLVAGDTNYRSDVFLRDLASETTMLVSVNTNGTGPGNQGSYSPSLSRDGRWVLFRSAGTDLAVGSFSGVENLLLRDLQAGICYTLTAEPIDTLAAALTPSGRYVAFAAPNRNAFYVWDSQLLRCIYTNSTSGLRSQIAISPDGSRVVTATSSGIAATTLPGGSTVLIAAGTPPGSSRAGWRFSGDSRWLVYTFLAGGTNQVYLHNFEGETNLLVSASYLSGAPAFGDSDSPDVSPDGRFVAFRSAASDLVPADTNGVPDIFLFDRVNSTMTLLSANRFSPRVANGRSLRPFLTSDGSTLLFESWASDMIAADFNQNLDIFAYSLYYSGAIPLFYSRIVPGGSTGQNPIVTWPTLPGRGYRVQFKDTLKDTTWQDSPGGILILGNQGYFIETSLSAQRFYRIMVSDGGVLNNPDTLSVKNDGL